MASTNQVEFAIARERVRTRSGSDGIDISSCVKDRVALVSDDSRVVRLITQTRALIRSYRSRACQNPER